MRESNPESASEQSSVEQAKKQARSLLQQKQTQEQEQLEQLIETAFNVGAVAAIEKARGLDNAFLLDALHDTLAQYEFYQRLQQEGKI